MNKFKSNLGASMSEKNTPFYFSFLRIHVSLGISLLFLIIISGCDNHINGIGDPVTKSLSLDTFTKVAIALPANVYLQQGEEQNVEIVTQQNIQDEIKTQVNNGKLKIDFRNFATTTKDNITIYITLPMLENLILSGSGKIFGETPFTESEILELDLSGSGEIDLEATSKNIKGDISGSGKMLITGNSESFDLNISGSGEFQGFGLQTHTSDINISGSGRSEIHVITQLNAHISGSGSIYYKGNPEITGKISGSGQIKNAN
ncbi:head GIN domain-containing protein [Xanthovirga aplysinae]|uniref:head GIN domain-containing protein n=1 Tax=Xanthovirga aplysinae TaxID=2529853 RepID=UPI0016570ECD|nr:head GIN domain-containing protein [Xanthovirga aplysinae]